MRKTDRRKRFPVAGLSLALYLAFNPALAQEWKKITPAPQPENREGAALVYDPVREHLLLFGGDGNDILNDTWKLEGEIWTQLQPANSPDARRNANIFWDEQRQRVVLFGGSGYGVIDRDTLWFWDGQDWSSSMPESLITPDRRDAPAAYDSGRDRIVLFGGNVDGSPDQSMADTWEFDGSGWTQINTATTPPDRFQARMGYDPVRQMVVMMGGMSETEGLRADTWIYDGSDWREAVDANTPVTSFGLMMCFDPLEEKLMLAGSEDVSNLRTWHFDGSQWVAKAESDYDPSGIADPSLAFDASRGYALYYRSDYQQSLGYRVSSDGAWSRFLPVPEPPGYDVDRGALLFDQAAGQMRLFGANVGDAVMATWRWEDPQWRYVELAGAGQFDGTSCIAYDAGRRTTVAFDGRTYELTSEGWVYHVLTELPMSRGAMAYDPGRGTILYFGGSRTYNQFLDDTWEWDGSSWQRLTPDHSPPGRMNAAMDYDTRRNRMVLFGGMGLTGSGARYLTDTWEWADGDWRQVECQGPADLRGTPSMAYDAKRGRIVLWAEQDIEDARVWEFDGNSWTGSPAPPELGDEGIIGYDPSTERLLLHLTTGSTWARESTPVTDPDGGPVEDGGLTDGGSNGESDSSAGMGDGCGCTTPSPGTTLPPALLFLIVLAGIRRSLSR